MHFEIINACLPLFSGWQSIKNISAQITELQKKYLLVLAFDTAGGFFPVKRTPHTVVYL